MGYKNVRYKKRPSPPVERQGRQYLLNKSYGIGLAVNFLHVSDEIENLVRVTDFVVIPAYNLNEGGGELDTSLSVEDRSAGVAEEVA